MDRQLTPNEADELEACFRAHSKSLFGYACLLTQGDKALADDLVQDTFRAAAVVWEELRSRDQNGRRSWLRTTIHNLAVTEFRHNEVVRRMGSAVEQQYRGPEPDTPRDALNAIALERCWQAIAAMPERQHRIAVMRWHLGMKHSEIAGKLDIAPGTVAAQLHGARKKLLAALTGHPPFSLEVAETDMLMPHPEEGGQPHEQ